jgi:hypothetical protein
MFSILPSSRFARKQTANNPLKLSTRISVLTKSASVPRIVVLGKIKDSEFL